MKRSRKGKLTESMPTIGIRLPPHVRRSLDDYCREFNGKMENVQLGATIKPSSLIRHVVMDWMRKQGIEI